MAFYINKDIYVHIDITCMAMYLSMYILFYI
jgi:hypothetical protein